MLTRLRQSLDNVSRRLAETDNGSGPEVDFWSFTYSGDPALGHMPSNPVVRIAEVCNFDHTTFPDS
jgi:hypothetical protein